MSDIGEELSELANKNRAGTMYIDNGRIGIIERTSEIKRSRHSFLARLKEFVNKLHIVNSSSVFITSNKELKNDIPFICQYV